MQEIKIEDLTLQLKQLVAQKSVKAVRELEEEYTYADFAEAIEALDVYEQIYIFRVLRADEAAEVFSYLEDDTKTKLAIAFSEDSGIKILDELQTDELADVLEELPANITRKILEQTSQEKRDKINSILAYNDEQVGSIMSVDLSVIKSHWTAKKAISKIRADYNKNKEIVHNFYVVDQNDVLLGDITLEELVFSNENEVVENLFSVVVSVHPFDDKELAAQVFSDQDRSTLPVVNKDNHLIGMITSDDVIDVIQEEATEDMYKMAGINPEAAEDNYLKTTVLSIVKSRVLWLIILMISATMSQFIIQQFTDLSNSVIDEIGITISSAIIVSLIPIISGSAGNAGSQSSTTVTRAAALGEIDKKDIKKVIWKEVSVGSIIGFIMFLINVIRLYLYFAIPYFRTDTSGAIPKIIPWKELSFVIIASSISLFIVVVFAKFLGTVIPLAAIKFKKDPAVMSAPILTTLSDAISTLIFFGLNIGVLQLAHSVGWL
ncbi:magnesium transporter [Mycoplasma sp. NEAQ87857]|uniref:magnesium transporter n=1 Tax=Mycoplasma sp. NEAQ87857 TaxID=2683967 RepID=UPI00131857EA|nr:magnesium transporter [Mycoplasma sp. NEAQ87857]QGZ97535.1 magnesium transporter [Mycoplasma sp. NEAQ87857]